MKLNESIENSLDRFVVVLFQIGISITCLKSCILSSLYFKEAYFGAAVVSLCATH